MNLKSFGARSAAGALAALASFSAGAAALDSQMNSMGLSNYDAYRSEMAAKPASKASADFGGVQAAQFDGHMNVPTFLWAAAGEKAADVGPLEASAIPEARARAYLKNKAAALKLSEAMVDDAELVQTHDTGRGGVIARFRQRVNGIEVFNRNINVMLKRDGSPLAASGYFATNFDKDAVIQLAFARDGASAITAALAQLGTAPDAAPSATINKSGYQLFSITSLSNGMHLTRAPRVKAVYYPRATTLEPAWYVELFLGSNTSYSFVVSAVDGSVLFRKNLSAYDAAPTPYSYRVFADAGDINQPFDSPLGNGFDPFPGTSPDQDFPRVSATANLVTLAHGPISTGDPWLPEGATTTTGNNVDSFLDTGILLGIQNTYIITDGYQANSGDLRTVNTGANTFDYPIQADQDPSTTPVKNAAIVNLFYMNNWLHDWWYDHGFDEVSGNGQTSNFGRGGSEGDPISAQGQDASGRDNSNMATPADGSSPTEQMFLFDGSITGEVKVTMPTVGEPLVFTGASFGPTNFDITAEAALANESSGPSSSDGCSALPAVPVVGTTLPALPPDLNLSGKIALIDRGTCSFTTKEQFATISGAKALIVINNIDGPPLLMGNADLPTLPINIPLPTTDTIYNLPAVMITKADGEALKAQLAAGQTLTMHVQRLPSIDYDGTFDEQIIAHEFFHHVSNRLVGNASGLDNAQGGGMGEGWSDTNALIMSVRPEDTQVAGNDHYQGTYALAYYAVPGIIPVGYFYTGIRRAPYTTDFSKNAYTFGMIADGTPTPNDPAGASNSEVHNVGEIWANALWNCYAGILNDPRHSFVGARSNMMDYVIAGLKLTPSSPTMLEARDGVLAAAMANDVTDYAECAHGFAVRGMGKNAVAPDRSSTDNTGVVENFDEFTEVPTTPVEPSAPATVSHSRFGGALGLGLLLPLLGIGALRRRRSR